MKECPYDPGGYFVVKGVEKVGWPVPYRIVPHRTVLNGCGGPGRDGFMDRRSWWQNTKGIPCIYDRFPLELRVGSDEGKLVNF